MSLSNDEKMIDRAASYEEVRFLKKQQWAVAAAGVILIGGLLTILKDVHVTPLDKFLMLLLITAGVAFGWYFLEDLQEALARVRQALDPQDWEASTRGRLSCHCTGPFWWGPLYSPRGSSSLSSIEGTRKYGD
jgi:hypothetical protein